MTASLLIGLAGWGAVAHATGESSPAQAGSSLRGAPASLFATESFVLERRGVAGEVRSVEPAGSYTYFEVASETGDNVWIVAMGRSHRKARYIRATSFGHRNEFESRRLGRTFSQLHFVTIEESNVK